MLLLFSKVSDGHKSAMKHLAVCADGLLSETKNKRDT